MITLQPFLWLVLGALLQMFGFGKRAIPLAPWLGFLFLLRFSHAQPPLIACLGVWLAFFVAIAVANQGAIKLPPLGFFGIVLLISGTITLPFLVDRLLAPRLPALLSTLVFPCAYVLEEWISSQANPFGTWGSEAYTQYGNLPLMQLASVTGLWGITFLITWFGSTGTWVWSNGFDWSIVRVEVLAFAAVWSLVMLAGGARLSFAPRNTPTVRVAGIGWPADEFDWNKVDSLVSDDSLSAEQLELARQNLSTLHQRLLEDSRREARAGAKIVAWTEACAIVLAPDYPDLIENAQQLAKEEAIYLLVPAGVIHRERPQPRADNLSVLVTPQGEVAFTYRKAHEIPPASFFTLLGKGPVSTHDSQYGRLAGAICFDLDHPGYARQVGRAGADILLAPYGDWETIKNLHASMAAFRAIENGVSLVRPAKGGLSSAVDPYGRVLASMDEFTAQQRIMVAQVPFSGRRTLYAILGDWLVWLSAAGLLAMIIASILHKTL
jgi:apolipoprotein N-acyltransferase